VDANSIFLLSFDRRYHSPGSDLTLARDPRKKEETKGANSYNNNTRVSREQYVVLTRGDATEEKKKRITPKFETKQVPNPQSCTAFRLVSPPGHLFLIFHTSLVFSPEGLGKRYNGGHGAPSDK
jgi:hypothetical protein